MTVSPSDQQRAVVVSVDGLVGLYGTKAVNKAVSFDLHSKELGVLVGGNGAGKTTVMEGLLGARTIQSKHISVLGTTPSFNRPWNIIRMGVRFIPQATILPQFLTVDEYIDVWALGSAQAQEPTATTREQVATLTAAPRDSLIRELSFGQKRVIEIILALAAKPRLLFADEPLAGLDSNRISSVVKSVESFVRAGGSALVVAHEPELRHWTPDWIVRLQSASDG